MGEEVAERFAVNPATGERIDLAGSDSDLARALWEIRGLEQEFRLLKKVLGVELLERMDKSALWTRRAGEYEIRGESPQPKTEYDGAELWQELDRFVGQDELSQEALEAAVEMVIDYKPRKAGINKLKKLGGEIAQAIKRCEQTVEPDRKVPYVNKKAV